MIIVNESGSYVSSTLMSAAYLSPDNEVKGLLLSKERGGNDLNDPSEGLLVRDWTATYNWQTEEVLIEAPGVAQTVLFIQADVTELSLAFDQNMNPFIAFVTAGVAKFWWYDTDVNDTIITELPAGSVTPRCCLDDKRDYRDATSDIILCYVHAGALKMRMERERYLDEHIIQDPFIEPVTGLPAYLKQVGMNAINRLQWTGSLTVQ
jgi:hypothetical protein